MKLRWLPLSTLLISASALTWYGTDGSNPVIDANAQLSSPAAGRPHELAQVRRACDLIPLSAFLVDQISRSQRRPNDKAELRALAQTYLERVATRTLDKGMCIGKPMFAKLPLEVERDLSQGLAAIATLHALGCDHSETFRIEAGLLSNKITGLGTAWQLSGKIKKSLDRAYELDPSNPRVLVGLGLRKLLSPRLLGHDAEAARTLLLRASKALPTDERPLVYAAMAEHTLGHLEACRDLLNRAIACNPNNPFTAVVLDRLAAGNPTPFADDVSR